MIIMGRDVIVENCDVLMQMIFRSIEVLRNTVNKKFCPSKIHI